MTRRPVFTSTSHRRNRPRRNLAAIATASRFRTRRIVLRGDVPSPAAPPSGCRFHTRCWLRAELGGPEICVTADPGADERPGGGHVHCHFAARLSDHLPGARRTPAHAVERGET